MRIFVGWAELREAQHADFVGLRSSAPAYNVQSIAILRQAARRYSSPLSRLQSIVTKAI